MQHLLNAWRQTGNRPAQLDGPLLPLPLEYLFEWFLELHEARGSGGFGCAPIGFCEMDSWSRLTGRKLAPFEVSCLRALDRVYLSSTVNKSDKS